MTEFETIVYEKKGAVAHVVLNRPRVINVYNMQMRDELYQVLEAVRDDPEVRVMVLRGAGDRGFCAGADLTEFGTAPSQAIARRVRWERDVWGLLLNIPKPSIAALHGFVLGSGVEMALLCDIRIAAEDAVFGMPEVGLGLIPAAGGTQLLPRILGRATALDVLLTGRRFSARDALGYGLVNRVVPRSELDESAIEMLRSVLRAPDGAIAAAKRAVHEGLDLRLEDALALEQRLAAGLA